MLNIFGDAALEPEVELGLGEFIESYQSKPGDQERCLAQPSLQLFERKACTCLKDLTVWPIPNSRSSDALGDLANLSELGLIDEGREGSRWPITLEYPRLTPVKAHRVS